LPPFVLLGNIMYKKCATRQLADFINRIWIRWKAERRNSSIWRL